MDFLTNKTDVEYAYIKAKLIDELTFNAWIDTEVARVCVDVKLAALMTEDSQLDLLDRDTEVEMSLMTNLNIEQFATGDNAPEFTGDFTAYETQ